MHMQRETTLGGTTYFHGSSNTYEAVNLMLTLYLLSHCSVLGKKTGCSLADVRMLPSALFLSSRDDDSPHSCESLLRFRLSLGVRSAFSEAPVKVAEVPLI